MITLLVTDGNLVPIGDPITNWIRATVTPQFNAAGSGTAVMPATPAILEQVNASRARMVVIRDGQYFMGGPIERPGPFQWSAAASTGGDSDTSEPGLLAVSFTDDFALIAQEVSYADPAHASTGQTATNYTATAINAETLLRNLVNLNVGPGAIVARRIPALALGTPVGSIGANVNLTTRFEPLGDVLRRVALAGGGLGFRTVQAGSQIEFTVYDPSDKSGQVRFSRGLGNLLSISYDPEAPTCTVAIVEGGVSGGSRVVRERVNSSAVTQWGRIVQYVNRQDTTDTTELDQAGDQALADGGEQAQAGFVAVDSPGARYGVDYALGDKVTVEIYPGLQITDVVRAVTLTATPDDGEVVAPLIGSDAAITADKTLKILDRLEARLGLVERG